MSWENYGNGKNKWNLDHYIPCSYFDLSDPDQQKICFHFLNMRPFWSSDNFIKNNSIPEDYLDHIEYIKHWLNESNKKLA
jgi:hypothetical protein